MITMIWSSPDGAGANGQASMEATVQARSDDHFTNTDHNDDDDDCQWSSMIIMMITCAGCSCSRKGSGWPVQNLGGLCLQGRFSSFQKTTIFFTSKVPYCSELGFCHGGRYFNTPTTNKSFCVTQFPMRTKQWQQPYNEYFRLPFDEAQLEIPDEDKTNPFPDQPQGFINNNPPKNNPIISGKKEGGAGGGGGGARRGGRRQQGGGGKENGRRAQQQQGRGQGGRGKQGAQKRQKSGKGKFFLPSRGGQIL